MPFSTGMNWDAIVIDRLDAKLILFVDRTRTPALYFFRKFTDDFLYNTCVMQRSAIIARQFNYSHSDVIRTIQTFKTQRYCCCHITQCLKYFFLIRNSNMALNENLTSFFQKYVTNIKLKLLIKTSSSLLKNMSQKLYCVVRKNVLNISHGLNINLIAVVCYQ